MGKRLFTKLKPNQCPICLGDLELVELDISTYSLTPMGSKRKVTDSHYQASLACSKCNAIYDAEKHGENWCIKSSLPKIKRELKEYNPFQL